MSRQSPELIWVPCHKCERFFAIPEAEWNERRKAHCPECRRQAVATVANPDLFVPPSPEARQLKRAYYKSERRWWRRTEDERAGVMRVVKGWR